MVIYIFVGISYTNGKWETRTCASTLFKAHKMLVQPVKCPVPLLPFPLDFPFPLSYCRFQILRPMLIYYLDRYNLSDKCYLAMRDTLT